MLNNTLYNNSDYFLFNHLSISLMISSIVLAIRFHNGISLTGDCKKLFHNSICIQDNITISS